MIIRIDGDGCGQGGPEGLSGNRQSCEFYRQQQCDSGDTDGGSRYGSMPMMLLVILLWPQSSSTRWT